MFKLTSVDQNFLKSLATLYAQSRPITLPPKRITAAAGTFLAWGSP